MGRVDRSQDPVHRAGQPLREWIQGQNATLYFGFHVECPDNLGIMNYCEGSGDLINSDEVVELGRRFKSDILIAGM